MVHTSKCTNYYIGVSIQRKMYQCHKIRKLTLKCLFTNESTKVYFNKIYFLGAKASNIFASKRKLIKMGTDQFDSIVT